MESTVFHGAGVEDGASKILPIPTPVGSGGICLVSSAQIAFMSSPFIVLRLPTPYVIRVWRTSSTGYEADRELPPTVSDRH